MTKARELIAAEGVLSDSSKLRRVVDLPEDLDILDSDERRAVNRFLKRARRMGAHKGYVARHRRAWWSVRLRELAPILATYMARRDGAPLRCRDRNSSSPRRSDMPPPWTDEELEAERTKAIEIFRKRRMEEPLEEYLDAFEPKPGHC